MDDGRNIERVRGPGPATLPMPTTISPRSTAAMLGLLRRHPVATYFVAAYFFSWSYWIPLALTGARVDFGSTVSHVPGLFGPAAAALLIAFAIEGREGVLRLLTACISFHGSPRWLAFAVLMPLFVFAAAALSTSVPPLDDLGVFAGFPELGVLPLWAMLVLTSYGEEVGWRGFALPRLQEHHSALSATVLLTCGWALWHTPAFFILAGYGQMTAGAALGFVLAMLGGSFVLTWIFNRTGGSVLLVTLWHASFNLVTGPREPRQPCSDRQHCRDDLRLCARAGGLPRATQGYATDTRLSSRT